MKWHLITAAFGLTLFFGVVGWICGWSSDLQRIAFKRPVFLKLPAEFKWGDRLEFVDVNHDKIIDIVTVEGTDIYVYFGSGNLSYLDPVRTTLKCSFETREEKAKCGPRVSQYIATDMDGDGLADLVLLLSLGSQSEIRILRGDGTGNFAPIFSARPQPEMEYPFGTLALADINHDGRPDIVNSWGDVLLSQNDGTYKDLETCIAGVGADCTAFDNLTIGEVNGDGNPDLIVMTGEAANITIMTLTGDGKGQFHRASELHVDGNVKHLTLADLDGDGRDEIIFVRWLSFPNPLEWLQGYYGLHWNIGNVGILKTDRKGHLSPGKGLPVRWKTTDPVAVADFNRDGKKDLVVVGKDSGFLPDLSVYFGNGKGSFPIIQDFKFHVWAWDEAVKTVDLNQDGKLDLVEGMPDGKVLLQE